MGEKYKTFSKNVKKMKKGGDQKYIGFKRKIVEIGAKESTPLDGFIEFLYHHRSLKKKTIFEIDGTNPSTYVEMVVDHRKFLVALHADGKEKMHLTCFKSEDGIESYAHIKLIDYENEKNFLYAFYNNANIMSFDDLITVCEELCNYVLEYTDPRANKNIWKPIMDQFIDAMRNMKNILPLTLSTYKTRRNLGIENPKRHMGKMRYEPYSSSQDRTNKKQNSAVSTPRRGINERLGIRP
jgi:hypothetical protein